MSALKNSHISEFSRKNDYVKRLLEEKVLRNGLKNSNRKLQRRQKTVHILINDIFLSKIFT